MSTGDCRGLIEAVPGSITLAKMIAETAKGSKIKAARTVFKDTGIILRWLAKENCFKVPTSLSHSASTGTASSIYPRHLSMERMPLSCLASDRNGSLEAQRRILIATKRRSSSFFFSCQSVFGRYGT